MELKFYRCNHCGNTITFAKSSGVPVVCCGEKMQELTANTTDAAVEKHVPVVKETDCCKVVVDIGSTAHPMAEDHFIEWVALQTKQGSQLKHLQPGQEPRVCFQICEGDAVEAVYAYCNLHGLWKA